MGFELGVPFSFFFIHFFLRFSSGKFGYCKRGIQAEGRTLLVQVYHQAGISRIDGNIDSFRRGAGIRRVILHLSERFVLASDMNHLDFDDTSNLIACFWRRKG